MISQGQKIPSVSIKQATPEGPADCDPSQLFAGKKVVVFSLPGAFTPTCSAKHLPGYVAKLPELKAQGVDIVACLSVNDAWTMQAWAKEHDALGKITMLADGAGAFSKALGIEQDLSGAHMGLRARREVPEQGSHRAGDHERPMQHQLKRRGAVEVRDAAKRPRQYELQEHRYSLSGSYDVPASNGVERTLTATPS